jgi:hypothetical protein
VPLSQFGPFADAFDNRDLKVPGYLELLHCNGPGVKVVLARIQAALSTDGPQAWVDALFSDPNWRPHLVGAATLLLDEKRVLDCAALWEAIDRGSWVTPQLVATGYFVDPAFQDQVKRRLENGCIVSVPSGLSPLQRHSATGPGNTVQRSAKLLSSLFSIGKRLQSLAPLLERLSTDPGASMLLEQDRDRSGEIAASWCDRVVAVFSERGFTLSPRST